MDPRVQIHENSVRGTYRVKRTPTSRDAHITTTVSAFAAANVFITIHRNTCKRSGRDVAQTYIEACHCSHYSVFPLRWGNEDEGKGQKNSHVNRTDDVRERVDAATRTRETRSGLHKIYSCVFFAFTFILCVLILGNTKWVVAWF